MTGEITIKYTMKKNDLETYKIKEIELDSIERLVWFFLKNQSIKLKTSNRITSIVTRH